METSDIATVGVKEMEECKSDKRCHKAYIVMGVFRSLVYNIYFYVVGFLFAVFGVFFLMGSRKTAFIVPRYWAKTLNFGARWILGLTYRVEGLENMPAGPCIIASKHQSAWETFSFCDIFPESIFVSKKELGHIPIVGLHFHKQKTIFVDRSLGAHAKDDMVRQAIERIAAGDRIIIYPEGTRTAVGAKTKCKRGIGAMYQALDVPVVPVVLNSGVYWPRRSFIKNPGVITVSILPAINSGLSTDDFMIELQEVLENRSKELVS